MKTWRICGVTTINVCADIEARTLEEALEIADNDLTLTEYCDGTIGVECYEADNVEVTENGWLEFQEEYCELIDDDGEDDDEDDEEEEEEW